MTCTSPPELDEIKLLAYLDGKADDTVGEHLRKCAHCRARAERLRRMEAVLAAALYRRTCPEPGLLGEYQLGLLDRVRAAGIARHVAECPYCAREIAQLHAFLGDLAPKPAAQDAAAEQVRVRLARLIGGARTLLPGKPAFAPVYAGIRGSGSEPYIYEADEARVIIDAAPGADSRERVDMLGLMTGVEPAGFSLHLWRQGRLIAAMPLDEGGNFIVRDLAPGSYELVLSGPDREIYIEELPV